jgi:hypothetical protein
MENQRDATITVYWSPRSAQHVSGKLLPIFRSARLRFFTAYDVVSCCCGRQGFGAPQRGTTCTVWRKLLCPKHVELNLDSNKLLLLHLVDFLYYFTYKADNKQDNVILGVRSCHHSCSGKATSITYCECVFVALVIRYAMRTRHIVVCGPCVCTTVFYIIS